MKKAQWISVISGILLVLALYLFGRTGVPKSENIFPSSSGSQNVITSDTILVHAKEALKPEQITWMNSLEQSVIRGNVKMQKLDVYHQLAHFWKDTVHIFEPYAWYEAEAARLENSEKSLSFAAHLFLENLRNESSDRLRKWKALQAEDLFERSLKVNPNNDSSIVGLGACYIFGSIADNPMTGILKVRQVVDKDSNNVFGQMVLGHGSILSGQYDKAIDRFGKVLAIQPENLEAILMMAEVYERKQEPENAVQWYTKALPYANNIEFKNAIEKRIEELKK